VGHKVHPNGFRLGVYRSWEANWFAPDKDYKKLLHEDLDMRNLILGRLRNAGIAKIETERSSNAQMTVTIHTAKPGIVIGKGGSSVDQLREDLEKRFQNRVRISIQEIKQPELDAQLVAENIASQIERRISYRRAMKQSILRSMRAGAKGVRVALGGRLRGSEMARREWDRDGRVPLHTLRADIEFGRAVARTTFGVIGVKVWLYKDLVRIAPRGGELPPGVVQSLAETAPAAPAGAETPAAQAAAQAPAAEPATAAPAASEAAPATATPGEVAAESEVVQRVPQSSHVEGTPGTDPASEAVAQPTVEEQVTEERAGTGARRRAPAAKAGPGGGEGKATAGTAPESPAPQARPKRAARPKPEPPVDATLPATGSDLESQSPDGQPEVPDAPS
jgi:small subunit ribosomal protein S3